MVIKDLGSRGCPNTQIAKLLEVSEGAVRYHRRRQAEGAVDGRTRQESKARAVHAAVAHWMEGQEQGARVNVAALHDWLVAEHGFVGSLRSLQRYVRRSFPGPKRRARRRVETPPGAQAQADWAVFPRVLIAGEWRELVAFFFQLSFSRYAVAVWSERRNELAWLHVHNEALRRVDGVPATVRIDNEKTAVSRGAGSFGEINPTYRRYAQAARFHPDACQPKSPEAKGKVERRILDGRSLREILTRHWASLEELQQWTDEQMLARSHRRVCPASGTTAFEAWQREKEHLGPLPILPEPFDLVVTRVVASDCTVAFEGRTYSVPFRFLGRSVEVRGCSGKVQMLVDGEVVASHRRHTAERVVLDAAHFEGPATGDVLPPLPLGRMGRKLAEIAAMTPERRPVDLYAALAEVAR
jgi:transposase